MMNVIYILFSYLMGAISFGIVMSRLFSLPDPRILTGVQAAERTTTSLERILPLSPFGFPWERILR